MNPRNKNFALIIGFLIVAFAAYNFAISKTIDLKNELAALKIEISNSTALKPSSSLDLKRKEKYLDSLITTNQKAQKNLQKNLLNILNTSSGETKYQVVSFAEPHISQKRDSTKVITYQFHLRGDYQAIENLLYKLEVEKNYGSLIHFRFEKQRDYRTNDDYLDCTVLLQNVN